MADPILPHAPVAIYFCESCGAHWPHMGSKKASQRAALHHAAGHLVVITERDPKYLAFTGQNRNGEPIVPDDIRQHLVDDVERPEPIYWCKTCGWSIAQDMSEQSYTDMLDHQGLGHIVEVTEQDVRALRVTAEQRNKADTQLLEDAITRIKAGEKNVAISFVKEPELLVHGAGRVVLQKEPVHTPAKQQQEDEEWQEISG